MIFLWFHNLQPVDCSQFSTSDLHNFQPAARLSQSPESAISTISNQQIIGTTNADAGVGIGLKGVIQNID